MIGIITLQVSVCVLFDDNANIKQLNKNTNVLNIGYGLHFVFYFVLGKKSVCPWQETGLYRL